MSARERLVAFLGWDRDDAELHARLDRHERAVRHVGQVEGLRLALDEVHREARWCEEQRRRHDGSNVGRDFDAQVEALLKVESILRVHVNALRVIPDDQLGPDCPPRCPDAPDCRQAAP